MRIMVRRPPINIYNQSFLMENPIEMKGHFGVSIVVVAIYFHKVLKNENSLK